MEILKKHKVKLIILLVLLLIIIFSIALIKINPISKIQQIAKMEEEIDEEQIKLFSYILYNNKDENNMKVLINVKDEQGLDFVQCPDNQIIQCNKEKQVLLDYVVAKDQNYIFRIVLANGEEKQENLIVNDEYIENEIVRIQNLTEGKGKITLQVQKYMALEDFKTYYKLGANGSWAVIDGIIVKDDYYDLYKNNLINSDGTVTVSFKMASNNGLNEILLDTQYYKTKLQPQADIEEGIIQHIENAEIKHDDYYQMNIGNVTYTAHTYVYEGDQEWNSSMVFGNANDVGTASSYAKNMVIVKVNGNLTIGSSATITAYRSAYGGPKGMLLYVTGDIINNGTITMTARGAKAQGQDVYLYRNEDSSIESIAANGGVGASNVYINWYSGSYRGYGGYNAENGVHRRAGGGASGAATSGDRKGKQGASGAGSTATSYSGGAGGGGCYNYAWAGNAVAYGGAGGNGAGYADFTWSCGGGAGNPGGAQVNGGQNGESGTGGLLVMYSSSITNNGKILSEGSKGGNGYRAGGGGSGGGSINIFYENSYQNKGQISARGGNGGTGTRAGGETANGGNGGAGSISIGSVQTGTYISTYDNY